MTTLSPSGRDDTAALERAFARGGVDLGEGTFYYAGAGIDQQSYFADAAPGRTTIKLAPGKALFTPSKQMWGMHLRGFTTDGGLGLFNGRYPGPNVVDALFTIEDFTIRNMSGTGVGHIASDWPNWTIRNFHIGGARKGTIGIALSGLTDGCIVQDGRFGHTQVQVKLGHGGNNAKLINLDMTTGSKDEQTGRTLGIDVCYIHVVPEPSWNNYGTGLVIADSKFGNEWSPSDTMDHDRVIVYADDDTRAGTSFLDRMPRLDKASAGHIGGHTVERCSLIGGGAMPGRPLVYSTTPYITSSSYAVKVAGNYPSHVIKFLESVNAKHTQNNGWNTATFSFPTTQNLGDFTPTNKPGMLTYVDPLGMVGS